MKSRESQGADSPYSFFNYGEGEFVSILSDELNLYRCNVRIRVTPFFPSGSYFISQARWKDSAGNRDDTRFVQDHADYEDPVYTTLVTTNEDVKGPIMLISPCATDDEEERCIRVTAVPEQPGKPRWANNRHDQLLGVRPRPGRKRVRAAGD